MVEEIKERYNLDAPEVVSVMLQVPREKFIAKKYKDIAYSDRPVSIGYGQTMSQPYTVAFMTDLLIAKSQKLKAKVLEVGTGSGYQAAILSKLVRDVYTVEIIRQLADRAKKRLKKLGYKNVEVRAGSGEWGWPEKAPFDAILITAGLDKDVPQELFDQINDGGVLVTPMGRGPDKVMTKFTKAKNGRLKKEKFGIFHFVPFVRKSN
jgi:protein-L-isoaspartate(D-aspartate) O-methyltransferase